MVQQASRKHPRADVASPSSSANLVIGNTSLSMPSYLVSFLHKSVKDWKHVNEAVSNCEMHVEKLHSQLRDGIFPQSLRMNPPKLVVKDPEAQAALVKSLNQHNLEYHLKCFESLITAQESCLAKLKETLLQQKTDFEATLQVLLDPLEDVNFLSPESNAIVQTWQKELSTAYVNQIDYFKLESRLAQVVSITTVAARTTTQDKAMEDMETLLVDASVASN